MQLNTFFNYREKKFWYVIATLFFLWIAKHFFFHGFYKNHDHHMLVQATPATTKDMPIILQAPGSVESMQSVSLTPQVTGTITKIYFQAGQDVVKDEPLFEIDPAALTASLQQSEAVLKRDQVQLLQNQADAKRYAELVKHEYVTRQQYEQTLTVAKAQQDLVDSDAANVQLAQIQVGHTKITAPVAGKTGNVTLRVGDLVTANSNAPLVTINPLNPIWVDFSIAQSDLPTLLQNQKKSPLQVNIFSEDGLKQLSSGQLSFVDNTVNNQTGTVLLKASVDNANQALWPGEMVSVQIVLTTDKNAIVIPMNAVQIDQQGDYVYVANKNDVTKRPIKLERQSGESAVIANGLKPGENVLTVIPPNFSEKDPVTVQLIG